MKFLIILALSFVSFFASAEIKMSLTTSSGKFQISANSMDLKTNSYEQAIKGSKFSWHFRPDTGIFEKIDTNTVSDTDMFIDDSVTLGFMKTFKSSFWTTAQAGLFARSQWKNIDDVTLHVSAFAEKKITMGEHKFLWENRLEAYGAHGTKDEAYKATVGAFVNVGSYLFNESQRELYVGVSHTVSNNFDIKTPDGTMLALRFNI